MVTKGAVGGELPAGIAPEYIDIQNLTFGANSSFACYI